MELTSFRTIEYNSESVTLLDQRYLPVDETYLTYTDWKGLADAIRLMVVRGAPAIGITAAYGIVLASKAVSQSGQTVNSETLRSAFDGLAATRPTAVNLFWALERMPVEAWRWGIHRTGCGIPGEVIPALEAVMAGNLMHCVAADGLLHLWGAEGVMHLA